jgi:hypothetical protein
MDGTIGDLVRLRRPEISPFLCYVVLASSEASGPPIRACDASMEVPLLMSPSTATSDLGGRRYRRFFRSTFSFFSVLTKKLIDLTSGNTIKVTFSLMPFLSISCYAAVPHLHSVPFSSQNRHLVTSSKHIHRSKQNIDFMSLCLILRT